MEARAGAEWLEADGLGGFASGTVGFVRTRRYHALLCAAARPPLDRFVLVNGVEAEVTTAAGTFPISTHRYLPGVTHPGGAAFVAGFDIEPWPLWRFALPGGAIVEQSIAVVHDRPMTTVSWRLVSSGAPPHGRARDVVGVGARLTVRLLLSGRDFHALQRENRAFRFAEERHGEALLWRPYDGVPAIAALANGTFVREPLWYRSFLYEEERARGLDAVEDLACPGRFEFDLAHAPACLVLAAATPGGVGEVPILAGDAAATLRGLRVRERRRRARFRSRLEGAAEAYLVRRGAGKSIIAGYPWFGDWGRDTFIALRGLCLATGRLNDARDILLAWSAAVSSGMLPNRFPDHGEQPEFNAVDASLWFVIAVHEFLQAAQKERLVLNGDRRKLLAAVEVILDGYSKGTRFGIRADADGLLACGVPGVQLTWMDAKVGDWVVTPRIGKPVEVQALWLNALWIASRHNVRWNEPLQRGLDSFRVRFWNAERKMLYDVIDVNHQPGIVDASFRPNQIFAVGGLPLRLITDNRAFLIVEAVKDRLWTPLGLRSLAPSEPGYAPHYQGGVRERDGAYHQGTVWPWLLGAFVDAWAWIHRRTPAAIHEARRVYLQPLLDHLETTGLGHISEIADAEAPHTPRGCPWQAWSVGEALWVDRVVLAEPAMPTRPAKPARKLTPTLVLATA
jgi:predicted glycogen debranching enzyme